MSIRLNSSLVRNIHTRMVLSAIREKTSTRAELARVTKLSSPTVGTIVRDLIDEGYIVNERLGKFSGGRKPMLLKFVPTARYIIGVNLAGTGPQVVLADLNGTFVSAIMMGRIAELEKDFTGTIIQLIDDLWAEEKFSWDSVIGIGMSVRGSFNIPNRHYFYPGKNTAIDLQDRLEIRYKIPVILEKNANAAVLAERAHRQKTEANDLVFINVDKGVSCGIIIGGRLCRGFSGNAGEFGHVVVERNGKQCSDCGQRGCLETVVSVGGILDSARDKGIYLPADCEMLDNFSKLVSLARNGDEAANSCFSRVVEVLSEAIISLVNVINPRLIVLGGNVVWHYSEIVDDVARVVLSRCWPYSTQGLAFEVATEAKHVFLHGAVTLILDKLFLSNENEVYEDWNVALKI